MLNSLLKYYPSVSNFPTYKSGILSEAVSSTYLLTTPIYINMQFSFFTKSNTRMKYFAKLSLLCAAFLLMASAAMAQFTANGTVTDEDGEPLIGATVLVKGTAIGTVTDFDGSYTLSVPESPATLVISYTGYAGTEVEVSSTNPTANLALASDVANLEEVVVTGFASSVKRKNLANAVASIGSEELTGVTSQSTMEGSLYGKFTGAEIRSNSGAPGGGMSVRLRGVTSVFGDQQPLYIVDGVYMDNKTISLGTNIVTAAAGGGNSASNQDDASNRIADLDAEDIENIEILKGASAAAIYGSRAAGGVVIITTKKGKEGKPKISFSQRIGTTSAIRLLGTRDWDAAKVESVYGPDAAAAFNSNPFTDYENELFGNSGLLSTSRFEVSGGTKKTSYFVGGTVQDNEGIVENTGYKKNSLRINIGQELASWLKLDVSTNYIDSRADRGLFNNSNSNTTVGYALAFTRPWDVLQADKDGVYPALNRVGSNVLETVNVITNREDVNRFVGGATLTFDIIQNDNSSLRLVTRAGLDQYTLRSTGIFPQSLSYYRSPGTLGGVSVSGSAVNQNTNLSAFLVHSYYTDSGLSFTTQGGVTQEDFYLDRVTTTATGLNGSQTNVDQAANFLTDQFILPQQDKGFFVQEEINLDDKVIATVGLRGDKSSNNGDANQLYFYPKANIAVNIAEFDGMNDGILDQLKLRAAYGEAGRFANFNDRFNAYNATAIDGRSGLSSSALLGNSNVGPERQTELEFGLDAAILDNKLGFSATYYIKGVDDLLMQQQLPTSTGFSRRVLNVGSLQNRGIELELNASPIRSEGFNWRTDLRWWKNNSEITRLDIPAFNLGGFAASLGQGRIEEGSSATQLVGTYNPADCATADCSDLDPNGDGFRVYGDAEPDFNMSWWNGFNIGNLDFNFLFHWKQGSEGVNLSTLLYDLGNTTWDYDDLTLDPAGERVNGDYRTSEWFAGNAGPWIEDTSYIRLREVGAYYTIPSSMLGDVATLKLGVSGRNLINIFDYNSYDPEVSNFGGNVLVNSIEVTPFPSAKTMNFHVKVTF